MHAKAKEFSALAARKGDDGWGDEVLALAELPEVAPALPELLAGLGNKELQRLVDLEDEALSIAVLGHAKGALLKHVIKMLHRLPDPDSRVIEALGQHPAAAKLALETWYSPDHARLATLAESAKGDKKCKKVAESALEFVQAHEGEAEPRLIPPFNAYLALRRIGATLDAAPAPSESDPDPLWHARVAWPKASFAFSVPKAGKSVLTFELDPDKNTVVDFHGTELKLSCMGHDDLGWQYYWERKNGAFVRTKDGKTQFLLYFFDWIGKQVAATAEPTNPLVGTWVAETVSYAKGGSNAAAKNEAKLTLKSDGTCAFARFSLKCEGSYKSVGSALTIVIGPPHNETIQMKADASFATLSWTDHDEEEGSDVTITLVRK